MVKPKISTLFQRRAPLIPSPLCLASWRGRTPPRPEPHRPPAQSATSVRKPPVRDMWNHQEGTPSSCPPWSTAPSNKQERRHLEGKSGRDQCQVQCATVRVDSLVYLLQTHFRCFSMDVALSCVFPFHFISVLLLLLILPIVCSISLEAKRRLFLQTHEQHGSFQSDISARTASRWVIQVAGEAFCTCSHMFYVFLQLGRRQAKEHVGLIRCAPWTSLIVLSSSIIVLNFAQTKTFGKPWTFWNLVS